MVVLTVGLAACSMYNSGIDDVKRTMPVDDIGAETEISTNGNQTALLPEFNSSLGNVPAEYIPNSEITFDAEGNFTITNIVNSDPNPSSATSSTGIEVGGNLVDQDPIAYEIRNAEAQRVLESLPVYTYEDYYIAGEGAVAQYDQDGQLIRVRGEYEYYSTLDKYKVNGVLPDGTYKGTYGQFSISTTQVFLDYSSYRLPEYRFANRYPKEAFSLVKTNPDGIVKLEDLPDYEQAKYVIENYIDEIRNADLMKKKGMPSQYEWIGKSTSGIDSLPEDPYKKITEEEWLAPPPRVFIVDETGRSRMEQQRDLVIEQFGESAWDNVDYVLWNELHNDGKPVVILKSTCEILSEEELTRIEREFLEKVAEKEGIKYETIVDKDGRILPEYVIQYIGKYIDDVPWEHTNIPDYLVIRVYPSFNGKTVSAEGFEKFWFSIRNKTGKWQIRTGLEWNNPQSPYPTGD